MNIIQSTITVFLSSGIICTIFVFLFRSLFNHLLSKDLAQFQTKFSVFHHTQADVIAKLYGHLIKTKQLMENLTFVIQMNPKPLPEKKTETNIAYNNLSLFYFEHRIYFDSDICKKIETVLKLMKESFIEFNVYQNEDSYKPDKEGGWERSWKKIEEEVSPLTQELEIEFRKLLKP